MAFPSLIQDFGSYQNSFPGAKLMPVFIGLADHTTAFPASGAARPRFLDGPGTHLRSEPFPAQRLMLVILGAPPAIGSRHFLRLAPRVVFAFRLGIGFGQPATILNEFF